MTRAFLSLGVVAIGCLLAGCQGQVSAELTTERPADGSLRQVVASLAGLEFEKADGTTKQVAFTANKLVNLNGFQNGSLLSLLANESLPEGTYTGVRLVFDTDTAGRFVSDSLARRFSLQLAAGSYADFDFKVEKDKSSRAEIILTLDLRQSLRFEGATGALHAGPVPALRAHGGCEHHRGDRVCDLRCRHLPRLRWRRLPVPRSGSRTG
jgi:hypothetical protein